MGGSSLAGLYGLAWIVQVNCTVVVGVGALVGTQSRFVSEFPPSVKHSPATFPQGGRLLAFAYALWRGSKGTAFSWAPASQSLGWVRWLRGFGCFCLLIFLDVQKNPTSKEVGFLILDFSIYILSFTWVIVAAITW